MPTFKKSHKYVYVNKGKPSKHTMIPMQDREVSEDVYKNWVEVKFKNNEEQEIE